VFIKVRLESEKLKNLGCASFFEQESDGFSGKKGYEPDLFVMQIKLFTAASFQI